MNITLVPEIAAEAKALVALAFRNGPIEDLHAGRLCPTCCDRPEFSHISDDEIKTVMKAAVDSLFRLLWQREFDPPRPSRLPLHGEQAPRLLLSLAPRLHPLLDR